MPTKTNPHMTAAQTVMEVVDGGKSLDDALAAHGKLDARTRAWLQEVAFGACRHYFYFDWMLSQLLSKPLKPHDRVLHFILINACHQIIHMRTPHYATVSESVAAVGGGRFDWARNLINGVLRNFIAEYENLARAIDRHHAAKFSVPEWFYAEVKKHWSADYETVLTAGNEKPPLTVRVNQQKTTRDAYLTQLAADGIHATATDDSALGVTFATPMPVEKIPGFADGLVSVQDESAQLVVKLFSPPTMTVKETVPNTVMRVLDGCAAPGGKTCLLLESHLPSLMKFKLVAVDLPARVNRLRQNLNRLNFTDPNQIEVVAADLLLPEKWWDKKMFTYVLLDVPCSGSGIIRRHPDIKHRRRAQDIAQFAHRQLQLLSRAWTLLENGGALVYVTCSILPAENDGVINQFLSAHADAQHHRPSEPRGIATKFGIQRLPGVHAGDGFYYCKLNKMEKA